MAEARGLAHLSRDALTKLVGILTDPQLPSAVKLDQARSTLERVIRDAESPASGYHADFAGVLDDAIAAASAMASAGRPRTETETRIRGKLVEELLEIPGIGVEGRYRG